MRKGGRIQRAEGGWKMIIARHGRMSARDADQLERTIEKRERRLGRAEIDEQRQDMAEGEQR